MRTNKDPDPLPDALLVLGVVLSMLDRSEPALLTEDEAVTMFRALAAENPEEFNPQLGEALESYAVTRMEAARASVEASLRDLLDP